MQPPERQTRTSARTRRPLAEAALEVFEEHGYEQVSVSQVASSVGVTERTTFRHFPTKPSSVLDGEPDDWTRSVALLARSPVRVPPGSAVALAIRELAPRGDAARDDLGRLALIRATRYLRSAWLDALTEVEHPSMSAYLRTMDQACALVDRGLGGFIGQAPSVSAEY